MIKYTLTLILFAGTLQAQESDSNDAKATLPELAVQGSSMGKLDLSRASILTGATIESRKIKSISDLSGSAPNFYVNSSGQQSFGDVITLRGIGNTQLFGDPAVSLYVDGVPAGSTSTYSSDLFDVDSVELLSGFQGHRFGKNSHGGVINIKTRRPSESHRSKLYASYGTFNTQNYRVLADGPTGENSSYYFGMNRSESDGFADNTNLLGNDATSKSWNGRLGFNWVTKEGLEISLGATWEKFDLGAQPIVPRASSGNSNYNGFYNRNSSINEVGEISKNSQHLSIKAKTDWGEIKSTTSRNFWKMDPSMLDLNFVDSSLATLSQFRQLMSLPVLDSTSKIVEERENIWEELQFSGGDIDEMSWLFGVSLGQEDVTGIATRVVPMPSDTNSSNIAGYANYNSITSYYFDNQQFAIHAKVSNTIGDNSSYEVGLRFDHEKKKMQRSKTNTYPFLPPVSPSNLEKSFDWVSPFAEFSHNLNEQLKFSFRSSLSQKAGGYTAYVDDVVGFPDLIDRGIVDLEFKEEKNWANELKVDFLRKENDMGGSLAVFWNDVKNYQFEKPSGSFDYFVDNADEVEIYGLEVELFIRPLESSTFNFTLGINESEIKKHSATSFDATAQSVLGPHNFAGKKVPFVPESTLGINYRQQINELLHTNLGLRNIGKTSYLDQTANETVNDSYTLLNANIGYQNNGWEVNLFGTNLTDEEYYTSLVTSLTGTPGIVGSPRVIGLSVSKVF
jgi:iron complex outermembrane receptor protein